MHRRASSLRRALASLLFALPWSAGLAADLQSPASAWAETAPDATGRGALATTSSEYRLPATIDNDILPLRKTELWARVYRPATLDHGPYPLLLFLHGNHGTCGHGSAPRVDDRVDYTSSGSCPSGYVVTPNHEGYGYLADQLASHGYIVVSVNANRGITAGAGIVGDAGLNLARGRLLLKHLQQLSLWHRMGGTPSSLGVELRGQLDLRSIGMLGHSRGGEGIRAAYNLYRDAGSPWPARIVSPLSFSALFEIGPVDGQTSRVLNADGVAWTVLLPLCDNDVFNLQGMRPYDRMLHLTSESPARQKSVVAVWGANHNFYNTEWQVSDALFCNGETPLFPLTVGSPQQQETALHTLLSLMRGNVGAAADFGFNKLFNSRFAVPAALAAITPLERTYSDSASSSMTLILDDFDQPTGHSSAGGINESNGVTVAHTAAGDRHDPSQRVAAIDFTSAAADSFFQSNFTAPGSGRDLSSYSYLNLRLARRDSPLNPPTPLPTNFKIQLVDAAGNRSAALELASYMSLTGPVGGPHGVDVVLQGAQIPLSDFGSFSRTALRGVRFTFDDTKSGALNLGNLRFSNSLLPPAKLRAPLAAAALSPAAQRAIPKSRALPYVVGLRRLPTAGPSSAATGDFELEIRTTGSFAVRDALPILRIGERTFDLSRYPDSGETSALLFSLSAADLAALPDGADLQLGYREEPTALQQPLGRLNKQLLIR